VEVLLQTYIHILQQQENQQSDETKNTEDTIQIKNLKSHLEVSSLSKDQLYAWTCRTKPER
jgi:hypothetical protein